MDINIELKGNAVWEELQRQLADPSTKLVDLARIWQIAGRPPGHSPRQWNARRIRRDYASGIVEDRGGRDGAVLASPDVAHHYAVMIDDDIKEACCKWFAWMVRDEDARGLADCLSWLITMMTIPALQVWDGCTAKEARKRLFTMIIEETAGWGQYNQETIVARVQRLLRGERLPKFR
jgi:hypothetical protein